MGAEDVAVRATAALSPMCFSLIVWLQVNEALQYEYGILSLLETHCYDDCVTLTSIMVLNDHDFSQFL